MQNLRVNMAIYQKGESGNPSGRPKGSGNKIDLREKINDLLNGQFEQIVSDFQKLTPKERISLWLRMAEFNLPRLRYFEGQKVLYRVDGLPETTHLANPEIIEIESQNGG